MDDNAILVTLNKDPFKSPSTREQHEWRSLDGSTLFDYLKYASEKLGFSERHLTVVLNGRIERDLDRIPVPGDNVCIHPTIGGPAFMAALPMMAIGFGVSMGINLVSTGIQLALGVSHGTGTNIDSMLPRMESSVPSISGLGQKSKLSSLSYGFSGPANSDQPGLPIPFLAGTCRVGLQVINTYVTSSGHNDVLYGLFSVGEGPLEEVVLNDDPGNIWVNQDVNLSDTNAAEYETRTGTATQTHIPWFDHLHQMRDMDINLDEPMKLLLHFEDSFPPDDSSVFSHSPAVSGIVIQTTSHAIGSYGADFAGGASDYIYVPYSDDWNLGTSDFTIDFHMRLDPGALTDGDEMAICDWMNHSASPADGWTLSIVQSGGDRSIRLGGYDEITGVGHTYARGEPGALNDSTWYHVAVVRSGTRFYIFVDGVDCRVGEYESQSGLAPASSNVQLNIGRRCSSTWNSNTKLSFAGHMDEFRITTQAEYTSDFTVPTTPYDDGYSGPTIQTRGEADQVNLHLECPYGLYSTTLNGEIDIKEVDLNVRFRRVGESNWMTFRGGSSIAASTRSPYKAQINIPFNRMTYTSITGTVSEGDTVTGNTTGDTATVAGIDRSNKWVYFVDMDVDKAPSGFFYGDTQCQVDGSNYINKSSLLVPTNDKQQYEFQVERTTPSDGNSTDKSTTFLKYMDEIYRVALEYPNTAVLGIMFSTSEKISGGKVGTVSVVAKRGSVSFDYFGTSGSYDLSNPAYLAYYIITDDRIGGGLSYEKLDQTSWDAWKDYCSQTVTDGTTRAEFNGVFDSEQTILDALMQIFKIGRAMLLKVGGKIHVVIEKPEEPTQLFSVGNIKKDSFSMSFLPKKDRPHAISVEYLDSSDKYNRKTYTHMGPEYDSTSDPLRIEKELLVGCTSEDQAKRYAIFRYQLSTMLNRTCSFEADIDAVACQPGDVVLVQHDLSWKTWGGRIVSATSNSVTLDRTINMDSGTFADGYGLLKVRISGTDDIEEQVISGPFDVDTSTVSISGSFSETPIADDVYAIVRSNFDVHEYRVMEMQRTQDTRVKLSCLEYKESCYYHEDYGSGVYDGGANRI